MLDKIKLDDIACIAKEAGAVIMEIYKRDFSISYKEDHSPLTEADLASNKVIIDALKKYNLPILSEEGREIPYEERKDWEYYWCIDPIDGTKEFIKRNGEFTVNIALIHQHIPILGVVYAPVLGDMYASKQGEGAFKNGKPLPLFCNDSPEKVLRVIASKSHLSKENQVFIDDLAQTTQTMIQMSKGSSLKLVMIAEGVADVYPRLSPTMEWDTAAADAIVRESGKMTYQLDTKIPLVYNKRNLLNPWFIVR